MKRNTLCLAVSLAAMGAGTAAAQYYPSNPDNRYAQGQTVRCESEDSRRETCRIESGSEVRLVNQLSRQSCVRGRNWTYDDTRITVTDGCRAEFLVTRDPRWNDRDRDGRRGDDRYGDDRYGDDRYGDDRHDNRYGQTIHCSSRNRIYGRTQCGDATGHYALVGRSANCVEGRTWGQAQRGVWVSGRCSANFRLTSTSGRDGDWRGGDRRTDAIARSRRCESNGNWRTYCGDVREGPYTLRDTRNRYCVEGRTWGNDARGLWVSGQCRAEFDRPYADDPRNDVYPYVRGVSQRD
jgi:hypothetical protein